MMGVHDVGVIFQCERRFTRICFKEFEKSDRFGAEFHGAGTTIARGSPSLAPSDRIRTRSPEGPLSSGNIASGLRRSLASVAFVISARNRISSLSMVHQETL